MLVALSVAATAAAPATLAGSASRTITVTGDYAFPPYSFIDEAGRPAGFAVELLRAVAAEVDLEVELTLAPVGAAHDDVREGRADVLVGLQRSDEHARDFDFSAPYTVIHHALFVHPGCEVEVLDDMVDLDVVVERGSALEEHLRSRGHRGRVVAVRTPTAALRLVSQRRFPVALLARHLGSHLIAEHGIEGVGPLPQAVARADYGFAVRSGDARLLHILNEGLATLQARGGYQPIADRWFGAHARPAGVPLRTIVRYAAAALIPLLLIVLLVLAWTWSMRKRVQRATEELRGELAERKRAEEDRRRLEAQLRQSQKLEAIGQLAGGLAHDFNNVLVGIGGFAELAQRHKLQGEALADAMGEIRRATRRGSDLIRQLLAFSRQGRESEVPIDIAYTVQATIRLLSHSIDRSIAIRAELGDDLPAVVGDPSRLENALLNLGLNARDAMPEGGALVYRARRVRLDARACPPGLLPGEHIELQVADTGAGMSDEVKARIFEPFFTTKGAGEGTGLGLAGVYGCVQSHGGHIEVETAPGQGTTFTMWLPLNDSDAIGVVTDHGLRGDLLHGTGHVLVVDDEDLVRTFAEQALEQLGYGVSLAEDGVEAVAWCEAHPGAADLVLLDMVMPRLGGLDAFRAILRAAPDTPVVVTSGYSRDNVAAGCLAEGARAFLPKPFTMEELANTVGENVRGAETRA